MQTGVSTNYDPAPALVNECNGDISTGYRLTCCLLMAKGEANIQFVEVQDLAGQYQSNSDEDLLRLALYPEELILQAHAALNDELARRRINNSEQRSAFREQEEQRKEEQSKNPGKLFLIHPYGIGRKRFGKAGRTYSPETRMERFKTTVFVVLFCFPLIPTGTFLVEREPGFLSNQMTGLKKFPLDWEQVLKVWVVASATLLAVIWAFKLLLRLLFR